MSDKIKKTYKFSLDHRNKLRDKAKLLTKEKNSQWKGGISKDKEYQKKRTQEYNRDKLRKLRKLTIETLGGKCLKCGFSDIRALQIDHINGGGSKERKEMKYSWKFNIYAMESYIKNENKYQLLCANCNWIKRCENNESKGKF